MILTNAVDSWGNLSELVGEMVTTLAQLYPCLLLLVCD